MDFSWNETQKALWDDLSAFGRDELGAGLDERDHHSQFSEEDWDKVVAKGLLGLHIPQAYGGQGYDLVTTTHAIEGLGYGCRDNGLLLAINAQMWSVQETVLKFGTEAQKAHYLPRLLDGRLKGAHAITEEEVGSDAFGMQTLAQKIEGGYRLNGRKAYITLGPVAGLIVLFATIRPEVGRWGVTCFLIDTDWPGVKLGPAQHKMGLRTSPMGDVWFEDVFIPDANVLGKPGSGAAIFNASMDYERSLIFTGHIGSMARQLDETIAFARERRVGGQPIGRHQSVSNRIADMKVRLETARYFMYKGAWLIDQGRPAALEAAMAKLTLSELFMENSLDAVRIHGGKGYMSDLGVERDLRDAIGGVIYAGASDVQRNVIAGLLGL